MLRKTIKERADEVNKEAPELQKLVEGAEKMRLPSKYLQTAQMSCLATSKFDITNLFYPSTGVKESTVAHSFSAWFLISLSLQIGVNTFSNLFIYKINKKSPWSSQHTPLQAWLFLPVCRVACHPDRGGRHGQKAHEQIRFPWRSRALDGVFNEVRATDPLSAFARVVAPHSEVCVAWNLVTRTRSI